MRGRRSVLVHIVAGGVVRVPQRKFDALELIPVAGVAPLLAALVEVLSFAINPGHFLNVGAEPVSAPADSELVGSVNLQRSLGVHHRMHSGRDASLPRIALGVGVLHPLCSAEVVNAEEARVRQPRIVLVRVLFDLEPHASRAVLRHRLVKRSHPSAAVGHLGNASNPAVQVLEREPKLGLGADASGIHAVLLEDAGELIGLDRLRNARLGSVVPGS